MSTHVYETLPGIIEDMKRRRDAVVAAIVAIELAYPECVPRVKSRQVKGLAPEGIVPPFPAPRLRHAFAGTGVTGLLCSECQLPQFHEIHALTIKEVPADGTE